MPVPARFLCGLGFAGNNAVRGRNLPDRKGPFELIEFVLKIPEHLFFLRSGKETVPDAVLVYLADLFIGNIRVLESEQDILFGQIGPLDTRVIGPEHDGYVVRSGTPTPGDRLR